MPHKKREAAFAQELQYQLRFRMPMQVREIRCFYGAGDLAGHFTGFPLCPRCSITMEREYQSYCDRCGQCLDWENLEKAVILFPDVRKNTK